MSTSVVPWAAGTARRFKEQLRWAIVLSLAALAVLAVLIIELVSVPRFEQQSREQTFRQLDAVAMMKSNEIERWLNGSWLAVTTLLHGPNKELLLGLGQQPSSSSQGQANQLLSEALANQERLRGGAYLAALFFYTPQGKIIASSEAIELDKVVSQQSYFATSLTADSIHPPYYVLGSSDLALIATQRVLGPDGKLVGVLAGKVDLNQLSTIIQDHGGLGETGEIYLVSRESNYLLTPSRYEGYALSKAYHSPAIDRALRGENGADSYANYHDPPLAVLGAYRWIPELQVALVVEIEQTEALAPVKEVIVLNVLSALIAIGMAVALGFYTATRITRPIGVLTEAVGRVAGGDHSYQVAVTEQNEIGVLARGFNSMTQQLKQTMEGLEQRFHAEQAAKTESEQLRLELEQAMGGLEQRMAAEQAAKAESERARKESEALRLQLERAVAAYMVFTQQVATGDLSRRLVVEDEGALGELGHGLNGMVESLQQLTRQVSEASIQLSSVATELMAATTEQASSAAQQSSAIYQTTTTIDEVKTIALETAQRATHVSQDSQLALGVARQGITALDHTISGMNNIRVRVGSIAETILLLAGQTQAIGVIIQAVNELADQSNLLALNAAIEAARAGEQGKSFAVVAQHVRELAERSKRATGQVREILGEIQQATNTAVMVTEEGSKGVDAGATLVTQSGEVIHRITTEVEKSAQANIQMAQAAQQQMAGMEQIGQAMLSIQGAMAQTLASTRQTELAARNLNTLATRLKQLVAAYRI